MQYRQTQLGDILREARENCFPGQGPRTIEENIPDLPLLSLDSEMMMKVFCNLLENAAKYSPADSPIYLSAENIGDRVLASVADRGVGIDESEQSLIFDRLYRSRSIGGSIPGSGMGLAISRAIVEAHHGTLAVTSQVGHGSVFTVSLPV